MNILQPMIGYHLSIRRGFLAAAQTAKCQGLGAFQIFPKNPRSLKVKDFDHSDAAACKRFCLEHAIQLIIHAPYPANLAAFGPEMKQAVIRSLKNDLDIAECCGALGLVVHFGKFNGKDPLQGYKNSLQCLNEVLCDWHGEARILIENQAGEGGAFGTAWEEMAQIRRLSSAPENIGFCLDTCHLYAAGLWNGHNWAEAAERAEQAGYFSHLKAVHLNDSRFPTGSRRDRHAKIGQGWIGESGFRQLFEYPLIRKLPLILETPAETDDTHLEEMRSICRWITEAGR